MRRCFGTAGRVLAMCARTGKAAPSCAHGAGGGPSSGARHDGRLRSVADMTARLELFALPGLPMVRAGDDLPAMILAGLDRGGQELRDGDVVVVAQKIVSKAEGRIVDLADIVPSARA